MSNHKDDSDICRDYLRKVCNRGSNCKFKHPKNAEKKLEFCHDFQNSICKRRNCRFVHCSRADEEYYLETGTLPEHVDPSAKPSKAYGPQSIPLCVDFMNGRCKRGINCKFRHQSHGDLEYEKHMMGGGGGMPFDGDEYDYDRNRRPAMPPGMRSFMASYYGLGGGPPPPRPARMLEEENMQLKCKIEELRKQVSDLQATNEVLLEQNARMRASKQAMSGNFGMGM